MCESIITVGSPRYTLLLTQATIFERFDGTTFVLYYYLFNYVLFRYVWWPYMAINVCMVITYSRVWINRVRLPILLVVS